MLTSTVPILVRIALSVVLVVAAIGKIKAPRSTRDELIRLGISVVPFAAAIALLLPWVELAAAVLLFSPRNRALGGILVLLLFTTFTITSVLVSAQGRDVRCPCFGSSGARTLNWKSVVQNTILTAAASWLVLTTS